jgi:hypothetical protein
MFVSPFLFQWLRLPVFDDPGELLSIVVDGGVELGGGLGEGEAVLEDGSADDIGE